MLSTTLNFVTWFDVGQSCQNVCYCPALINSTTTEKYGTVPRYENSNL